MTALRRAVDREASTRPAALLRIGLAVLILTRFADELNLRGPSDPTSLALVAATWIGVLAMLAGFRAQLATAVTAAALAAGVGWFGGVLRVEGWTHHHVTLLLTATLCAAATPCGRSYSIDRWLAVGRAERAGSAPPPERGPVWAQLLIAVQLSAVYFWGAVDKCTAGWLRGDKFEAQLMQFIFGSDPPEFAGWRAVLVVASVGTVALELALSVGLWFRRARRWLVPAGVGLHVFIYVTLPVHIFSALSVLLYLAYLDPDEVHRTLDRLSGAASPPGG
jgi:hypothetical protein